MICHAATYTERIEADDLKNDIQRLEAEVYAMDGCPRFNRFRDVLRLYNIRRHIEKQAKDDPTTQE
jgi:hypothetical protein